MIKINKIYEENGISTLLGMNGGMVESPDGKRIVYARKKDLTKPQTEIWVCSHDCREHRMVYEVECMNHNGPSCTFTDHHTIVFRDAATGVNTFRFFDIDKMETVMGPICAKESHRAENGLYPFSVSKEYLDKNPSYPEIDTCGIYGISLAEKRIRLIATEEDILDMVRRAGLTPNAFTAAVSHVQLNPKGDAVMMRLSVEECPVFGALGCLSLDLSDSWVIPDKPVHQLWFDDDTYMATRQFYRDGVIEMETSYIARFARDGQELEVLGGIGNHIDGSPDRRYFAGDRCYPGYSPDVFVYQRGDKKPILTVPIPDFPSTVWNLQVHPNPSFSMDGKRLYFNYPCGESQTEAAFIELDTI